MKSNWPIYFSPNPLLMYSANVKDSEKPIADWLPYPPQLNINIGFGLRILFCG